jgi:hypothetical protein
MKKTFPKYRHLLRTTIQAIVIRAVQEITQTALHDDSRKADKFGNSETNQ